MNEYHKIQTLYLRDPANKHKTLLEGHWAKPEFKYLAESYWEFTEKVDGTNIRVMIQDAQLRYGGRTDHAHIPTPLLGHLQSVFEPQLDELCSQFPHGACLYGEGYGQKIQKAGKLYNAEGNGFCLFDVKVGTFWLEREAVEGIADQFALEVAPIVCGGTLLDMVSMVKEGVQSRWGDFVAEGLIARPSTTLYNRKHDRVIAKLKTKDFARQ